MVWTNVEYKIVLAFLYSLFATMVAMPYIIKLCKKYGYTVLDMHKYLKPKVPVLGGLAMMIGVMVSLILSQLLVVDRLLMNDLIIFYFIAIALGVYGLTENIFHFRRRFPKVVILFILSIFIASIIPGEVLDLGFISIPIPYFELVILSAIYVMVVTNLVNLHAGFNGLSSGATLIMLLAAGIKSYMLYGTKYLLFLMPILGAVMVFFWYNKHPSKIFEGDVGTFLMGGALGTFLILNSFYIFGIVMLIPHIITFLLDLWVLVIKKVPDKEFPPARKDGLIIPDKTMRYKSLKNVLCTWMHLTERNATLLLMLITGIFCVIAVIWI